MVDVARLDTSDATTAPRAPDPRRLGRWWALGAAPLAGLAILLAFPPIDLWWSAPVGVALLAAATYRRGVWAGAGLGLICGLALFIPLLSWAGGYVGAVWLYLPVGESAYLALLGAVLAAATPAVERWPWTWPLLTGCGWVLQEALRDRTPFGGFPWGRLAFSQAESPLLGLAALGGAPLVTFGVGALGGLVVLGALAITRLRRRGWQQVSWRDTGVRMLAATVAAAIAVLALPAVLPAAHSSQRPVTVAIVQGNVPRLGLDFNAQRRAVLDNHVDATLALAADVADGRVPRPDFVVWPENASDIDPLRNADARARIDAAAAAMGVPILVGGLLLGPGPREVRNVGIVWEPGAGPTQTYVKRHPVPFAEYMPIRPFVRLITDKVDLVQSDFIAGPAPGVLTIAGTSIGDVICFEVAYDGVVRDTVTGGAKMIVVQTNNATFNEAEARQQLAMVRLRAVEHGRPALMASTVGISAFVDESGHVYDSTTFDAPAVIMRELSPAQGRTIATRLAVVPEVALAIIAVGLLLAAITLRRRTRRGSA